MDITQPLSKRGRGDTSDGDSGGSEHISAQSLSLRTHRVRRGEVLSLRWNQIDFARGLISFREPRAVATE